jgi:hypothetical protein
MSSVLICNKTRFPWGHARTFLFRFKSPPPPLVKSKFGMGLPLTRVSRLPSLSKLHEDRYKWPSHVANFWNYEVIFPVRLFIIYRKKELVQLDDVLCSTETLVVCLKPASLRKVAGIYIDNNTASRHLPKLKLVGVYSSFPRIACDAVSTDWQIVTSVRRWYLAGVRASPSAMMIASLNHCTCQALHTLGHVGDNSKFNAREMVRGLGGNNCIGWRGLYYNYNSL